MAEKKGETVQVGDSYLIFTESDKEQIGKLAIFRGRAQVFVPYSEFLGIVQEAIKHSELCDREIALERERLKQNTATFSGLGKTE